MMLAMPLKTKDERVELRVDPKDLQLWRQAADASGLSLSNWMRKACSAAAAKAGAVDPELVRYIDERLAEIEARERGPAKPTKKGGRR